MSFLALVCALLLEQAWPLRRGNPLYAAFERYADYLERQFNGLQASHGAIAWLVAVLPLALLTVAVYALLHEASVLLAMAWSVAVLYVAMGFRRFSHCFTEIAQALREQNINTARDVLGRWRGVPADELNAAEISRVAIELGLLQAHRYVLGPIFWFVVLGPVGALVYRAADLLADRWGKQLQPEQRAFAQFAERAFFWIDWLPARMTAASFAIAGNFEDAAYCWRTQAAGWGRGAEGVVLASGAGALGVKLGGVLREEGMLNQRPELGIGDEVNVEDLRGVVGLIWRALVLWLVLLMIVSMARVVG
ncbi:MAG: CobD/CbiB family protein [Burkholderiales bacterium]|jgi:adenosylcobinamide-phosphate synthase|nr:CobD/CbiB family protein [Burkholderiales bacterium]